MKRQELIAIVDERLEEWGEFFIKQEAVPVLLIGMSTKEGQPSCLAASSEEIPRANFIAFLKDLLAALEKGEGPSEWK